MRCGSPPVRAIKGTVYVAVGDEPLKRQVGYALRALNLGVVEVGSTDQVPSVSLHRTDRVLLIGTPKASDPSAFDRLAAFRVVDQSTPTLLCAGAGARELRLLPQFVRSAVDGMVVVGIEGWDRELGNLVTRYLDHALPEPLLQSALPGQRNDVRAEQAWMARRSQRRVRTDEVAEWFRISPRTLLRHHRRDGSPSPHRWLQMSRLLHVAHQLDETTYDLTIIARRLGFPSEADMSMFVHRMSGESPSALRAQGALRRALLVARGDSE